METLCLSSWVLRQPEWNNPFPRLDGRKCHLQLTTLRFPRPRTCGGSETLIPEGRDGVSRGVNTCRKVDRARGKVFPAGPLPRASCVCWVRPAVRSLKPFRRRPAGQGHPASALSPEPSGELPCATLPSSVSCWRESCS